MTQREILEKWADITSERLAKGAPKLRGALMASISAKTTSDSQAKLTYLLYGMYRDMGVGRGKKFGDSEKIAGKKGRKANKWYSKRMRKEVFALSKLLSDNAGKIILASIDQNIPQKLDL
jgi:hypothetical protein